MAPAHSEPLLLGIEGGGTHTVAMLTRGFEVIRRLELGPCNLRLLTDAQLTQHFRKIQREVGTPDAVGVGMAGVRGREDRERLKQVLDVVWNNVPIQTEHDLESALRAAGPRDETEARVIVLSGTGSCCYGSNVLGATAKVGGWGHILGDKGSGFEIGLRALKAIVYYLDRDNEWSLLGANILRNLHLNTPEELIAWVQGAPKAEVAALAVEVFNAAGQGDKIARDVLKGAASILARDALACADRLVRPGEFVEFVMTGSVLLKQPKFAQQVRKQILASRKKSQVITLHREGAWGAVDIARSAWELAGKPSFAKAPAVKTAVKTKVPALTSILQSPTEQRNPLSMKLDRMSLGNAIEVFLTEDEKLPGAIRGEKAKIGRAIDLIVKGFKAGGRLIYVGAGTSGRLGVLDASECPPTFRTPHEMVQGIMAGGQRAIWESIEGAEDDVAAGADSIKYRQAGKNDVVVGIAASGRTPFVWGALAEAKERGAKTVLLCLNPHLKIPKADSPDVLIAPDIGPEILTGSTRLKSGTATKMILNMFTTLAMVRMGKVISNLMVDVTPTNEKLQDRATRIVCALTKLDYDSARRRLIDSNWEVQRALKA